MRCISMITVIFLIFSGITEAQNYNSPIIKGDDLNRNILFIEQVRNNLRGTSLVENSIFLNQIGERNLSDVLIIADKSEVSIYQNGNDNEVNLKVKAGEVTENIIQIGDNNYFVDISLLKSSTPREIDIYQKGKDQSIIMTGSNNLSDKMKIKQKGNNSMLIINNFN